MSKEVIERFESFKRTLIAARDVGQARDDAFLQGLRAGIQVCINGVDAEIEMIRAGMNEFNKEKTNGTD